MPALWPKGPRQWVLVRRTANKKAPHDGEAVNSLSTYEAMATISDLHEIYAFQFGFARLMSKFVAFCCERDRVTEIRAPLSSRLKLLRIAIQ